VTDISPARQLARIRTTGAKSILLPKRTGQFAAVWTAEQGTRSETTGLTYGMLEIPTHEMYALIDISEQNLEDSAFNLEGEITFEATEQFGVLEGSSFVTGTAVGQLEGFITNTDVGVTNSYDGTGKTARSGQLSALVAVSVVEALPNGNLVIQGSREIQVNDELQVIQLSGVVRPVDIGTDNVVLSSRIADAQITYTGLGVIDEKQRPGWFARLFDYVTPF
jgi:flagellar basal body L-ring protein FlgH